MNDVVINKVQTLQRCVLRAREEVAAAGSDFASNATRQDAAVMNVVRACEATIDLANHLIRRRRLGVPNSSGEAFRLLAQEPTMHVDVQAVARELGMSYETFRKKFRAYTGKAPGRYVSQIVANRACELLYAGNMSVKEVAATLGFCNEFHFSRRFKAITGQSPSRFAGRVTTPGEGR